MRSIILMALLISVQWPLKVNSVQVRTRVSVPFTTPTCPCLPESALNHSAGPNDPSCSGSNPDGGIGQVWGYQCGTVNETRWLLYNGCVVGVL